MNERPTVRQRTPVPDATGAVLGGRYVIQSEIARGGMATVYLAQDSLLKRAVAVKVLTGDLQGTDRDAFLREARAVAQLSHPNIVEVYDAGVEGALAYIVMQYVPGDTLRDVIARETTVDPRRAVELTIRLADALDLGHRRGVVHCDMKPGNVLLGDHGEPKIVDFGIARGMATATDVPSVIAGTVGYIAPEQIEGKQLDGRADVYSLAAVLYEMLTGRTPFAGGNLAAVAAQRLTQPPPPPRSLNPAIAPELELIVLRGLERDPGRRYPTAHAFAEGLRGYLDTLLSGQTRRSAPVLTDSPTRVAAAPQEGRTERLSAARNRMTTAAPPGAIPVERVPARDGSRPWLFLTVAGTLAAVIAGLAIVLAANLFDGGGGTILMPQVLDQPIEDAARSIKSAGLVVREVRLVSDPAPFGTVIDQTPPPDTRLEHGEAVDLRVSVGPAAP